MDASKYSVIARCLQAASGALPVDQPGNICLINEDEGDLMETIVEGSKTINQDYIASDVKTNTPAAYLYQELSQRMVFCVNKENVLKCYAYNAKDMAWSEADLGLVSDQKLHPDSGLCACFSPKGIRVYFQNPSGSLGGIAQQNGTWKKLGTVLAKPAKGTPLSVLFSQSDSAFYLYYMSVDGSLHYMNVPFSEGEQKDNEFPGSKFDTRVDNFMAFRGETEIQMEAYFLSSDKVFQVDSAGKRVELGSVGEGAFVPNTTEQCWSICYVPVLTWNPCCRPVSCWCW